MTPRARWSKYIWSQHMPVTQCSWLVILWIRRPVKVEFHHVFDSSRYPATCLYIPIPLSLFSFPASPVKLTTVPPRSAPADPRNLHRSLTFGFSLSRLHFRDHVQSPSSSKGHRKHPSHDASYKIKQRAPDHEDRPDGRFGNVGLDPAGHSECPQAMLEDLEAIQDFVSEVMPTDCCKCKNI